MSLSERDLERFEERRVAEWLEQASHSPAFDQLWKKRLIGLRGNEDDRDVPFQAFQFTLQIRTAHPRQSDVEDQTVRLAESLGLEESLGGRECLHVKPGVQ